MHRSGHEIESDPFGSVIAVWLPVLQFLQMKLEEPRSSAASNCLVGGWVGGWVRWVLWALHWPVTCATNLLGTCLVVSICNFAHIRLYAMSFHALALPHIMLDTSSTDGNTCYLFFCNLMAFDLLARNFHSSQRQTCVSVSSFVFNWIKPRKLSLVHI